MPKAKESHCHDCGVLEGEIHTYGCDMEECPFCGGQLISCNCQYIRLGYKYDPKKPFSGLPEKVYMEGLPPKAQEKWRNILEEKGRIPYIDWPIVCAKCGEMWPNFFMVPGWIWWATISPRYEHKVICLKCFHKIQKLIQKRTGFDVGTMVPCPACGSQDERCYYCRGELVGEKFAPRIQAEHQEHEADLAEVRTRLKKEQKK